MMRGGSTLGLGRIVSGDAGRIDAGADRPDSLQGLRLHFLTSSTACRKILLDFFYCLCFKFCSAFTFCLLVVCLCLNFLAFLNSFLSVQCCKLRCLLDCLG